MLPVLLSARRVSPPPDGPPHGGKIIGKDAVTYKYEQVGVLADPSTKIWALRLPFLAYTYSLLSFSDRGGQLALPPFCSARGEDMVERRVVRARVVGGRFQ